MKSPLEQRRDAFNRVDQIPDLTTISNPVKIVPHLVGEVEDLKFYILKSNTPVSAIFPLVVIDTETTGIQVAGNEIVELAAVKYDAPNSPCAKFQTLIKPRKPIPFAATEINHITNDMVADAPSVGQVIEPFQNFIAGCNVVGHNLKFDLRHLLHNGFTFSKKVRYYDTYTLSKSRIKDAENYKLAPLCQYAGITIRNAHRAIDDCRATYNVFQYLIDQSKNTADYTEIFKSHEPEYTAARNESFNMDYNQNQRPTENGQTAPQQQPPYQQSPYQQPYVQQPRNPYQQPYQPRGGRYRKPPKKKKWPIILAVVLGIFVLSAIGNLVAPKTSDDGDGKTSSSPSETSTASDSSASSSNESSEESQAVAANSYTTEQNNALRRAKDYLRTMHFSREGLIGQLEFEKYSHEDAVFAVDHCDVDWNEQAVGKAKDYLETMPFSYSGLIGQLEYEGFTTEEATHGVDSCGADWNEQAIEKAKDYLENMSFSRDGLVDQLIFEGFTEEQAEYGVNGAGL